MTVLLLVSAQIPALNPDLETTPGCADFGVDAASVVRIIGKSHFEGEHSGVAGESFPSNSHVTDSIPVFSAAGGGEEGVEAAAHALPVAAGPV